MDDEIFDKIPLISKEEGMKMRTGQPTPVSATAYERFVDALKPSNIISLGLRRLMRSRSPWE